MASPSSFIRRFCDFNILVVGDAILDVYDMGTSDRLCREAPAPVVILKEHVFNCGGAANTAVNIAALGAHVSFLGVTGTDAQGDRLADALERGGVDTRNLIRSSRRRTLSKTRICASSSILVRVDEGDTHPIGSELEATVLHAFHRQLPGFDAVILSDYGDGLFSDELIRKIGTELASAHLPLIVDAKDPSRFRSLAPLAVKPNYEEAIELLGLQKLEGAARVEQLLEHGDRLLDETGARLVASTLDMEGTVLFERNERPYLLSCLPKPDKKTIGAGDSFVSTFALSLAAGAPPRIAARLAAAAAAVVIEKDGTGICSDEDLQIHFSGQNKRITELSSLVEELEKLRRRNKRIVFTNGCFDLLHRGHVDFLKQARALGDVLVVALNTDASINRLKGDGRPVNSLEDRMEVLAGLNAVDYLVAFDEESPAALLREIRPDVFTKGGTYSIDSLPEAELIRRQGGEIEIVPFHGDVSTSHLIQKIQSSGMQGAGLRSGSGAL